VWFSPSTHRLLYPRPQTIGVFSTRTNASLIISSSQFDLFGLPLGVFHAFPIPLYTFKSIRPNCLLLGFFKAFIPNLFIASPTHIAQFIACSQFLLFSFRTASSTIHTSRSVFLFNEGSVEDITCVIHLGSSAARSADWPRGIIRSITDSMYSSCI
jgi:hypothetical protein